MSRKEFMEKAHDLLYKHKQSVISAETMRYRQAIDLRVLIATALESADASGYARGRAEAVEECARIAEWAHMVEPDGGSPTIDEQTVAEEAGRRIRTLSQKDTRHAD